MFDKVGEISGSDEFADKLDYLITIMDEDEKDRFIQKIYLSQKRQMFLYETCFCNNIPFHCYRSMVTNPQFHNNTLKGLKYIMCELSGDHLTYYTRFKLSKFLSDRLS